MAANSATAQSTPSWKARSALNPPRKPQALKYKCRTCATQQPTVIPLLPAAYCGVLTLTGEPLPEGLEDYEGLTDSTGAVTYVVPSDCFFSFLAQLEGQDAANFTYDDSGEETAGYGLIVVEAP